MVKPSHQHRDPFERETKILNVISNTSVLLMSLMTEVFSDAFTNVAQALASSLATGFGAPEETIKDMDKKVDDMKTEIPKKMLETVMNMKHDMHQQLQEKKKDLIPLLADPIFDKGITIAEDYHSSLPPLTQDLDELSLLKYMALLKTEDGECTHMFQALIGWMNELPQPKQ